MKRGWFYTEEGKVRFIQRDVLGYADSMASNHPNLIFSTKKLAQAKRNEWVPSGLECLRDEQKDLQERLRSLKKEIKPLLKLKRKLEQYGTPV